MKLRILVIDDDEDLLFLAEQLLNVQDEELDLVKATNAQAAVQLLDEGNLDAVICDFHLGQGQMNGLEILEWVRDEEIDIPFIIFTGHSREEIAIKALNLGADYYIEKSDDLEGLFTEIGYHIREVVRNKRTEEALFESEQRYRTLVQSLNDLIFVVDSEDRFSQYHSLSSDDLFEPPGRFIGKLISEIMPPAITDKYISLESIVRASGERQSFDYELKINGQKKWFTADMDLHEDKESIVVTVADISERKQAELDLRYAEREWRNTFDSIPDIVFVLNNEFEIVKANKTMSDVLGIPPKDLIGKRCYELMHRSSEPFPGCPHLETIKKGLTTDAEINDPCLGKPYLVTTSPIQDDQGEQVGVVHIAKDISERIEAERTIKESETQFRAIFEEAGIGMALVMNGHILEVNSALLKLLQYDANEIKGLTIDDITHPDDRGKDQTAFQDLIASDNESYNLEKRYIRKDGEIVWGKLTVTLIRDPEGTQHYAIGMVEDITEHKRTEMLLSEERNRAKTYLNLAGTLILATDTNLDITMINDTGCRILGLAEEEILGKNWIDTFIPEREQERIRNYMLGIISGQVEPSKTDEGPVLVVSGNIRWIQWSDVVVREKEGQVVGILSAGPDVTEKKKAEEERRTSEEKFRAMFESAEIGMTVVGVDDYIIDANTAYQDLVGYNIDEIRKMTIADFTHPDDVLTDSRLFEEVSSGKRDSYHMVKRYIRKDGEMIWVHLTVTVVKDEHAEITFIVGMAEDITARKNVETALSESEHKYRTLIENVQNGIQIAQEGISVYANEILANMLGYSIDEIIGSPFSNLIAPEDLDWIMARYGQRLAGEDVPSEYEVGLLHKDGSRIHTRLKVSNFEYEGKLSTIATIMDVTDRRKAEAELRESEQRYRLLFENLSDGLFITNLEGIITMCSPQGARLFGATPEKIIGTHFSSSIHPDDKERLVREFQMGFENKETQPTGHEVRGIQPDGSEFYYHITNTLLMENDEPVGYQSLVRDISELKQIEGALRESENRFRQIVESTPIGIHMYELNANDELVFIGANPAADRLLGVDNSQFIGKTIEQAFPPLADTEIPQRYKEVALEGGTWSTEQIDYEDDKISGAFEVYAYQTIPKMMVASFLEITDRKVAEQAAAISHENFQTVFETIDDLLFIVGLDSKILTTNHSVGNLLGYSDEELNGLDVLTLHPPDGREEAAEILKTMMEGKTTVCPIPMMAKDGTVIPVETRIILGRWSGEDVLFGVSRDITQRMTTEEVLEKRTHDLSERVKELTCLYEATRLLRDPNISESDTFQRLVELLPPAWQYSNVTCARITIYGEEYTTSNFKQSKWKQTADIKVFREKIGIIEVYYTEERPDHFEGPFLNEERDLIDTLAKHVCECIERRISEKELRESDERLRTVLDMQKQTTEIIKEERNRAQQYLDIVGSIILTLDNEGKVSTINRKGCEVLGYDADEIIGLKWTDNFIPQRLRAEVQEVHSKAMSGKITEVEEYENPILTKSGEERLLSWRNVALLDDDGNICGAISSAVDITDQEKAEKKVRTEKEFTETALNSQRDTFFVFDSATGKAIRWNKIFQQISEYSDDEIATMKAPDSYYDSDDLKRANIATQNLMKEGRATLELTLITKSGKRIPFEYEASLMRVNDNNEYIVSVGRDMTERKNVEKAIEQQLDFLENVLESLSHPFYVIDVNDYTIKLANKVARIGNLEENPTCHFVTHRSATPCSPDEHPCPLEEVKKTKKPVVVEHTHFDENDNVREMEVHAYPILDDNGNVVQMIEYALDITDHKQALRALEYNEKRFRELYENAPLGYQTLDERAHILNVNQAWLDALGYSLDEVVGRFFGDFLTAESKHTLEANFVQFKLQGCIDNIEYEMIRKDGTQLIARFNGRIAYDEDGNFKHTHCIFQDVTELKYADDLLRRQKEELSDLAHIMSHDLGNKMKNIRTLISLLKREPNEEVLGRIDNLAQQTSTLLQSSATLADSGRIIEEYESVDLSNIVQEIAATVIPDHIRFEMDSLPSILGDSQRITQIIQNLLLNAVEHGSPSIVEVRKRDTPRGIALLVKNDGEIVPTAVKRNIFQRGYTTKGKGRGLGLTIVKKLVEAHGWRIGIEPTDSTSFKIFIPHSSIQQ